MPITASPAKPHTFNIPMQIIGDDLLIVDPLLDGTRLVSGAGETTGQARIQRVDRVASPDR